MDIIQVKAQTVLVQILIVVVMVQTQAYQDWAGQTLPYKSAGQEKVTKLHFYLHDFISGTNPTAIRVAGAPSSEKSPTPFGSVFVIDDPLTAGPNPNSGLLGRAQGLYGSSGQKELALFMGISLVFTSECRFKGSTLSVLTHNPITHPNRELSIVGGTGYFKLARGFITVKTYWFNATSGDAIIEYTCTIIHY